MVGIVSFSGSYFRSWTKQAALLASAGLWLAGCGVDKPVNVERAEAGLPEKIDYNLHVKPILSDKCFFCHGPDKNSQKGGLELATREGAMAALKSGHIAIQPGDLAGSEVFHRIISTDESRVMPPVESNRLLTDREKAVLIRWIEQGADYKPHWALIKPEKAPLPEVRQTAWPRNGIDYFVLQKLEEKGWKPAPEADKETLLRRVTLDLTGLPPTVEEQQAFLNDKSPDAYEKVVNRLLSSPHYGEKMAVDWLDLARYADTHGYTVDRYRAMWPWRNWVIDAFNRNRPFSQFLTWQLAGDMLPNATKEQRLATGFNRNHSQNMEGGIVNEEFRVEYVADRTNTLGTAMLGLTVECARCHDHKYDPISQKDYYSLFAFFNNVDEVGQISWDDAVPVPTLRLPTRRQYHRIQELNARVQAAEVALGQTARRESAASPTAQIDLSKGLQAHFTFDKLVDGKFVSSVQATDKGEVADPVLAPGKSGMAFQSNGDDILKLGKVGVFNRSQPFTIGVWVKIPKDVQKAALVHKGNGDILYNFRGYFLNLRDGKPELLMAHTWPANSIVRLGKQVLPKEKWLHLTMTYDGSSKANGLRLFVDGTETALLTEKDNLYKDILFKGDQTGLMVGADWRGPGFKKGLVDELTVYNRELSTPEIIALARGAGAVPMVRPADRQSFALSQSPVYQEQLHFLQQLRDEKSKAEEEVDEVMVMEEMKTPRPTYLLKRGVYDAHGEQVSADVPNSILPLPERLPHNRLGLAQWLLDPDHPLTARVVVNRYWQTYFGTGLQKNANNFGNQGGLPSHPELLDWLAVTFRESGWNMKAMQKLIVLSATYRQASTTTPAIRKSDPDNTWLARGPGFRLSAEMIRDHALASSGLLSPAIGGPSVKPYQPEGLWAVNGGVYQPDTGEKLYRRSLYTFWRRTNPPPSMNTFDAPSRSYCVVQRQKTSTPLQALVLLNDPQFVEATRAVAARAVNASTNVSGQITYAFRLLACRQPKPKELQILLSFFEQQRKAFAQSPEKMKGWLTAGESRSEATDQPALAAAAATASLILNSDAFITRH